MLIIDNANEKRKSGRIWGICDLALHCMDEGNIIRGWRHLNVINNQNVDVGSQ